ncbi:terpene synthase family protein [Lentzea sp. NPDC059081]|uniref:terpene synthase family protein n=1 Tax=Lentzea sp. NPDC059081 TaxID=3346719 RepID=UPI00369275B9
MWYPRTWDVPPDPDLLTAVGGRVRDWACGATLMPSGHPAGQLRPLTHAERFACHSYPRGRPERLLTIAKLLTLWTMDDDIGEQWGISEHHTAAVFAALRGDTPATTDPYFQEWRKLGDELRDSGMSERWFRRFLGNLNTWYDNARLPERGRRESYEDYVRRRPDGTGAAAWLDLLEFVHHKELSPEQHTTSYVRNAYVFAKHDYMVAFNDVTSVARDERRGVPNLCSLIADKRSTTRVSAARELAAMHLSIVRRRLADLDRARAHRPDLTWWQELACAHHLGMARAHVPDETRYGEVQELEDSSFQVRVVVGEDAAAPNLLEDGLPR